jgi:uncharacterized RDD family membrane protein YckC
VCADVYSQLSPSEITGGTTVSALGEAKAPQGSTSNFVSASEFGGFWRRFAAVLIDGIILSMFTVPLSIFAPRVVYYCIATPLGLVYYIGFWTWKGQTPGKMVMGIKIIAADGGPIGLGRAIIRYLGFFVSAIILYLGFIMIAFDGRKQGLHDKIAGTFVVRT